MMKCRVDITPSQQQSVIAIDDAGHVDGTLCICGVGKRVFLRYHSIGIR